jgi:hypothetical protein
VSRLRSKLPTDPADHEAVISKAQHLWLAGQTRCSDLTANRISHARDGLTEWYAIGPLGIEQGFSVPRPLGTDTGRLTLSLGLAGSMRDGQLLISVQATGAHHPPSIDPNVQRARLTASNGTRGSSIAI